LQEQVKQQLAQSAKLQDELKEAKAVIAAVAHVSALVSH
jgi:hypothetical protein